MNNSLMIGKLQWEGTNKAILYIGFFGKINIKKITEIFEILFKCSGIEVYYKALGRMLVENISTTKVNSISFIQSAQTYRPHIEALKAYLLCKCYTYTLLTSNWSQVLLNLIYEFMLKKGFSYLGNCSDNKILLYKPYKSKEKDELKVLFFQYVLYAKENIVKVEFYIDPELIHKDEFYEDIYKPIEIINDFFFKSFYALEYLIIKCLRHKLNDEDYIQEDDFDEKIVMLKSNDDFYCYIDIIEQPLPYKKIKKTIIKEMACILLSAHSELPSDQPSIDLLHKHSNIYTFEFDIFKIQPNYKYSINIYGKIYKNLLSAYSDICDYCITDQKMHHFVRYLSKDSILLWILPNLDEFISNIIKNHYIAMSFYECFLTKIHSDNFESTKMKNEWVIGEILSKNIDLIKRVYKSAINYTYCEVFDNIEFDFNSLLLVINSCNIETITIEIESLYSIMHPSWSTINELAENLCRNVTFIFEQSFSDMDLKFSAFLEKYFTKIQDTNFYLLKDKKQGIFLQFGKSNNKLSHCLNDTKIPFSLYKSPFSDFFHKEIASLKKQASNSPNEILLKVSQMATSLTSKQALYLLAKEKPVTDKTIETVLYHLNLIDEKIENVVSLDLIIKTQDFSDLLHIELMKNKILYTRYINNYYFLVSTEIDKNFQLAADYEKDCCSLENLQEDDFSIDFWVILQVIQPNSIKFIFFFPDDLEFKKLNPQIIKFELVKRIKTLELRINQRILLKNLLETGKISSMLLQAESDAPPPPEDNKGIQNIQKNRIWLQKQETVRRKPSLNPQGSFKLQLQHIHDFAITDRLVKLDALNALSSKFSIPPFSIDNLEDTYMLIQNQDVWLFKFIEVQGQVPTTFQGLSKSPTQGKGYVTVRYIRLQIYGIDSPPDDTINKLEKIVADQLQQTSLAKLADCLIKNQKKTMTSNDYTFILGNTPSEIIMYQIPSIVTKFDFFLSITKQNLLRFLSPFQLMDSIVLIYNFLTIIDTTTSTNNNKLIHKHSANTNYLGNTFGKALALINFDIVYFDGENITKELINLEEENQFTFGRIETEVRLLQKYYGMSTPSLTGHYLEVQISKNGNFYTTAFIEQLNSCISESIFEYILEKILTTSISLNIHERYLYISECSFVAMHNSSLKSQSLENA